MSRRGALDVVVAGGGVVGAATALMLAREGLQVALVEPKAPAPWQREVRDLRVYAFAPDNAALFGERGDHVDGTELLQLTFHGLQAGCVDAVVVG